MTDNLEKYDTVKASLLIKDFASDFSTWYVRRSRERVKTDGAEPTYDVGSQNRHRKSVQVGDKQFALATMRYVLNELSKLIAPVMPFLAEAIYGGVGAGEKESVHLESWTEFSLNEKIKMKNEKLLEEMEEVRKIVSLGLEARAKSGIKVRQPLQKLKIKNLKLKNNEDLIKLIKYELNVKEIIFDDKISGEVELGYGNYAEAERRRGVKGTNKSTARFEKKAGLNPGQKIILRVQAENQAREFMEKFSSEIKKSATPGKTGI